MAVLLVKYSQILSEGNRKIVAALYPIFGMGSKYDFVFGFSIKNC